MRLGSLLGKGRRFGAIAMALSLTFADGVPAAASELPPVQGEVMETAMERSEPEQTDPAEESAAESEELETGEETAAEEQGGASAEAAEPGQTGSEKEESAESGKPEQTEPIKEETTESGEPEAGEEIEEEAGGAPVETTEPEQTGSEKEQSAESGKQEQTELIKEETAESEKQEQTESIKEETAESGKPESEEEAGGVPVETAEPEEAEAGTEEAEESGSSKAAAEIGLEISKEGELAAESSFHAAQAKPSKVIGLKGEPGYTTGRKASGEGYYYTTPNQWQNAVVVKGTPDTSDANGTVTVPGTYKDQATGLYKYNNTYYIFCNATALDGFVQLSGAVLVKSGSPETYWDGATGFYKVDGATYTHMSLTPAGEFSYVYPSAECVVLGSAATFEEAQKLKEGYAVADTDGSALYYNVNGIFYEDVSSWSNDQGGYSVYAEKQHEMSFDKFRVNLSWNKITDDTVLVNKEGLPLAIGYELEVNGRTSAADGVDGSFVDEKTGTLHNMVTSNSSTIPYVVVGSGEKVSVRVRAVYYHSKDAIYDTNEGIGTWQEEDEVYIADMYGAWSDAYTYTGQKLQVVSPVTGLSAVASSAGTIEVKWKNDEAADSHRVRYVRSVKALNITDAASFYQFYSYDKLYQQYLAAGGKEEDIATGSYYTYNNNIDLPADGEKPYCYIAVAVADAAEGYLTDGAYSVVSVVVQAAANIPQIQNFKVIKTDNGNQAKLSWTPVDAKMAIYVIKGTKIPKFYNYEVLDAYGYYPDSNGEKQYLDSSTMTDEQWGQIKKSVADYREEVDGESGSYSISDFNLDLGVKYTFVVFTYDDGAAANKAEKASIGTVSKSVQVIQDGNQTITKVPVNLTYYTATGKEAKATYTAKITKPSVVYATTKTSVKLTMSASNYTGFEIYRLSGKKYKKIMTTTENTYTDSGLKADTKYSYKVRAYYYDKDTKVKSYSEYKALSVTTSATKNFAVKVTEASKTSAKITWTKVSGATKYEVYRASGTAEDPSVISRQLTGGNYATALANAKYTLVKTVSKASAASYTDKGLKGGETYNYLVIAHYTSGKKDAIMLDSGSAVMELQKPQNVTAVNQGKKVNVKWDPDKFASQYELRWKVTDKYGKTAKKWKTASTKSASKNISIGPGEYLTVQVRAYGSNKTYSDWTEAVATNSLAAPSSIKAVNVEKTGAVKITWKKVSGAKYYVVKRSTSMPTYNADDKRYIASGRLIAKESNDDKGSGSEVYYREYYGVTGSVKKTTAYDYARLDKGVTYYYTVTAYGEKGTKIESYTTNAGGVQILASGKPASVLYGVKSQITSLKNSRKGQVAVKFNKVSGVKTYYVYRATKKNGSYTLLGSTKTTTYTDKKASKGKTYYYKVVGKGTNALKANFSLESAVKSVKVKK